MGELVEGTFNVRTLAFMGTSGLGHAEVILKSCDDPDCNVIGLQEVRRDGYDKSSYTAAGHLCFTREQTEGKAREEREPRDEPSC